MKTYLVTTGLLFALLALAHLVRMVTEYHDLAMDPWYLAITAVAAALSIWAFVLLRRRPRS